jgi:hypothetical protein
VLKLAGALAVLLAAVLLVRRSDPSERRGALVSGGLVAAGFALAVALLLVADELITRNVMILLIPLIVLLAGGLGARRAGMLGAVGAATLCTIGVIAALAVAVDWRYQRPDWRGLAAVVDSRLPAGNGGRAIVVENFKGILPLKVYLHGLRFMKHVGAPVGEVYLVGVRGPGFGWFCWLGSACNMVPATLDRSIRIRGFKRDGPILHAGQFSPEAGPHRPAHPTGGGARIGRNSPHDLRPNDSAAAPLLSVARSASRRCWTVSLRRGTVSPCQSLRQVCPSRLQPRGA